MFGKILTKIFFKKKNLFRFRMICFVKDNKPNFIWFFLILKNF